MSFKQLCKLKANRAMIYSSLSIPDRIEEMYRFMKSTSGSKAKMASSMREAFRNMLMLSGSDIDPDSIFNDLNEFTKFITRETFDTFESMKNTNSTEMEANGVRWMSSLATYTASILDSNDIEFLNTNTEFIREFKSTRTFLLYASSILTAEKLASNPIIKILMGTPRTFDRGLVWASNPLIKPFYAELSKTRSFVNSMTDRALESKEKFINEANKYGFTEDKLGSLVLVMEHTGMSVKEGKIGNNSDEINSAIKNGLMQRFTEAEVTDSFIAQAKEVWIRYRKFNYGEAVGDDLISLPKGYRPFDEKYSDGFLPMMVGMQMQKSKLVSIIKAQGNVDINHAKLTDTVVAADKFKITGEPGKEDIEWKWKDNYFPHHKIFSDDEELAKDVVERSVDEFSALYSSKNLSVDEVNFVHQLDTNIENIRHKANLSTTRLFTAYLSGISGYGGSHEAVKGMINNNTPMDTYATWSSAAGNGGRYGHSVIKDYIDNMNKYLYDEINVVNMRKNALFKKAAQVTLGGMATGPLMTSATGNLAAGASQLLNEFGIGNSIEMIIDWNKNYATGSIDEYLKTKLLDDQIKYNHGIKLTKHTALSVEYGTENIDATGIKGVIDNVLDVGIKASQTVGEQGFLAPFALAGEVLKWSVDLVNTKVNIKPLSVASTTIGNTINLTRDNALSMSGSEALLLNVESMIKFQVVSSAIKLKNAGRTSNGLAAMDDAQTKSFIKQYISNELTKSDILDSWRHIVGDFSKDTKPFFAWLPMEKAETKAEILKGLLYSMDSMFRHVGIQITSNFTRAITKFVKESPGRKNYGYLAAQVMLGYYQMQSKMEGLDIPVVAQMSAGGQAITMGKVYSSALKILLGANVSKEDVESMYFTFSKIAGGIPLGGAVQQMATNWLGTSASEIKGNVFDGDKLFKGFESIWNDLADPIYIGKSLVEMVDMHDDSINKLNAYQKEYSVTGIPVLNALTALNKPVKQTLQWLEFGSGLVNAKMSEDQELSNKLLRNSKSTLSDIMLSGFGLNAFVKLDMEESNGNANKKRKKMKYDQEYRTGWQGVMK